VGRGAQGALVMSIEAKALSRRELFGTIGSGIAAACLPGELRAERITKLAKPNVVLILVDDLGYGDLACYGAKDMRTPVIDRLAVSGARFENFYANCPVCSPTRASVMTGRYPDAVGVPGVIRTHRENSWGCLSPEAVLLPSVLRKAGYHSALVGKWHLGLESPDLPNERGFDHFHGFLGDMMDDYFNHRRHGINYMRLEDREIDPEGHATELFTQWASDYIRERAGKDQPFFLYLCYNAPHAPIQPPEKWLKKVTEREKGIDPKRAKIVALIEHMDDCIGKVIEQVKASGIEGETLVFFVSDNGGDLNAGATCGELRSGKEAMFEGGIKVPMCAVWPGRIPAGTTSERIAMTMDIFPTICEVCGASFTHEIEGRSILPALMGKAQDEEDRFLFWVRREGGPRYGGRDYYAARKGDWKLLQNSPFEPLRLYNLKEDPREERPLDDNHEMRRVLFQALQDHVSDLGTVSWQRKR